MRVVVVDRATGSAFVLVGAGYGAFASSTPGVVLGSLAPKEQRGAHSMVAVTGPNGGIAWYRSEALVVVSIDDHTPAHILHHQREVGTVVQHLRTGAFYLLVGTGFGAFATARPSALMGNTRPIQSQGQQAMVCVCDDRGDIGWMPSQEVAVFQVDGCSVEQALTPPGQR